MGLTRPLKCALCVEMFEEIALVGLVPGHNLRTQGTDIQPFDFWGIEQTANEHFILRDGRDNERGPDRIEDLILGEFADAYKWEQKF